MKFLDSRPLTYLITPGRATDANIGSSSLEIFAAVGGAVDLGVSLVQLREKNLSGKHRFELAVSLMSMIRGTKTRLLINDRADIAKAAGADGVHLTSRSLPVEIVRKIFGYDLLIGVSTHSPRDLEKAIAYGADFAVFGPVFDSPGKPPSSGLQKLTEVCKAAEPFPVLALGGIDASNYRNAIEAGAAGFAAIRSLNDPISMPTILNELAGK